MTLDKLNALDEQQLFAALEKCCGSSTWVRSMLAASPFQTRAELLKKAELCWAACDKSDALEAFSHHPKIGDKKSLEKKFAATREWAGNEQSGMNQADEAIIQRMITANENYFEKYGYIFIVCATGKTASEMLAIIESRLDNNPDDELAIAKAEQNKITLLRLQKLIPMSQITTHVLDTAKGTPAKGIKISLQRPGKQEGTWELICSGTTNDDGRIPNFLDAETTLAPGTYRMLFETKAYFESNDTKGFYPYVPVIFTIQDTEHYHVPLLLNPFGYSTYRGS